MLARYCHRASLASYAQALIKKVLLILRFLRKGLLRELDPGPLAPEARIIPLDQAADAADLKN